MITISLFQISQTEEKSMLFEIKFYET